MTMRRARLAADQQHLVDLVGAQARLLAARRWQGPSVRSTSSRDQLLELRRGVSVRARWRGPVRVGGDERQVDRALLRRRQLALGALGRLLEALQGHAVAAQVDRRSRFWNSSISQSMIRWSKSSPPR